MITLFLKDGTVYASAEPVPEKPEGLMTGTTKYPLWEEYYKSVESYREKAVRCENLYCSLIELEGASKVFIDGPSIEPIATIPKGQFYSLPDGYGMRVENKCKCPYKETGSEDGHCRDCADNGKIERVATIYREPVAKEETQDEPWTDFWTQLRAKEWTGNFLTIEQALQSKFILTRR